MTVRFFMLQSHYSSTLNISNEALKAAQKGYKKLINGFRIANKLEFKENGGKEDKDLIKQIEDLVDSCHSAMNDDFNPALTLGHLFNLLKRINSLDNGSLMFSSIGKKTFENLLKTYSEFVRDILGILEENPIEGEDIINVMVKIYSEAKQKKQYDKVDQIKTDLKKNGIILLDKKSGLQLILAMLCLQNHNHQQKYLQ